MRFFHDLPQVFPKRHPERCDQSPVCHNASCFFDSLGAFRQVTIGSVSNWPGLWVGLAVPVPAGSSPSSALNPLQRLEGASRSVQFVRGFGYRRPAILNRIGLFLRFFDFFAGPFRWIIPIVQVVGGRLVDCRPELRHADDRKRVCVAAGGVFDSLLAYLRYPLSLNEPDG
jgi:hypothetical protein